MCDYWGPGTSLDTNIDHIDFRHIFMLYAEREFHVNDVQNISTRILHKSDQSSSIMNEIARNEGVVYKSSGANLKGVGREDDKLPETEEIKTQDFQNKHTPYLVGTKSSDKTQALSTATTGGGKGVVK